MVEGIETGKDYRCHLSFAETLYGKLFGTGRCPYLRGVTGVSAYKGHDHPDIQPPRREEPERCLDYPRSASVPIIPMYGGSLGLCRDPHQPTPAPSGDLFGGEWIV